VKCSPLISIISHIYNITPKDKVPMITFIYSTKAYSKVLFLERLRDISNTLNERLKLKVFITSDQDHKEHIGSNRRFTDEDLTEAVGKGGNTVCYVCGPPKMTDHVVELLGGIVGSERVFCEKWW
jgi:NAD(P)H-flavin reductase